MRITLDGKEYLIEQTETGVRVGVVIVNETRAQHAYVRWLRHDGKRAARVVTVANCPDSGGHGLGATPRSRSDRIGAAAA